MFPDLRAGRPAQPDGDRMGRSIYSGKLLGIPAPLSFVVYTGTRGSPKEMRLSDAFSWDPEDLDCHLENVTRILHLGNVREGGMLWQYIRFCRINDECRERSGDDKTAYIRSLRERCMEENIFVTSAPESAHRRFLFRLSRVMPMRILSV